MKIETKIHKFENYDPRDVVSFDFDGCLHTSIVPGTTHPINFNQPDSWEPFELMHAAVKKEHAAGNKVIVITARDEEDKPFLWQFIKKYELPIEEIICTNDNPKLADIVVSGAFRHYDDAKVLGRGLSKHGIEFYLVDPAKKNFKRV